MTIYAYAPQLQELQTALSDTVDVAELDKLNEALTIISNSYNNILILTLVSLAIFFFIVCFFQSLTWRITFRSLKKSVKLEGIFDDYKKYLLKFAIITLPVFIIILPSLYYFIVQLKSLFLNFIIAMYNMAETTVTINYIALIALFLLIITVTYFAVIVYILLNKYKIREAVKKAFKVGVKKAKLLLPIHFLSIIMIVPIIYIDSFLAKYLDFRITLVISLLIYFAMLAYFQVLMNVLLEKE